MLEHNHNVIKEYIRKNKKIIGAWAQAASNITAEILASSDFDLITVDLEHSPSDIQTLITQIQAMQGYRAVPFARAPWNDFVWIKKILDAGIYGLFVPYVNTKEEAEAAVKAVRYPTEGIRGVAGSPRAAHYGNNAIEYFRSANEEIVLYTAIETPEGVKNTDSIVKVEGIDGIFIGSVDLATNMGHLADPNHPEVQNAIKKIENSVKNAGKSLAAVTGSWEDTKTKFEKGYQLVLTMSDTTTLGKIARDRMASFRESFPNR